MAARYQRNHYRDVTQAPVKGLLSKPFCSIGIGRYRQKVEQIVRFQMLHKVVHTRLFRF
jgi:hypothetical protein